MLLQCFIGRLAQLNRIVGRNGAGWEITAGFASKAARKRSRQAEVQPFSQVFLQFHEHVMSPSLQINSAATAVNEKSLTKLFDFVKTLASCTNTYPPAMAEPITIMVRDPSGKPRTASALLRTTGGDCSQSVARSLAGLFASTGAPSEFHWDAGMWTLSSRKADEGDVQAARAKAAAAGIPSSEPMTLDELEAVQARMDAKRKASPSSKFNAGEHFLSQPSFAAQPVSSSNVQHTRSGSEPMSAARQDSAQGGADQDAVWKDLGAEGNSLQSSGASPAYVPFNSPDAGSSDGAGMLRQVSGELSASQSSSAAEAPSYEVIDDEDGTVTSAEEALDETEMAELKAELQKLDPLLAALAAVPWIDPEAEDGQRVPFIKSTVLDQVEGMGWDVRGGVMKIWAGERDMDNILLDKDAGSAIALKTVMQYALKFEQDFGAKAL